MHALIWLDRHRDLHPRLIEDDAFLTNAVEEFLRIFSPASGVARSATRDLELGEHRIRKGQQVYFWLSGARAQKPNQTSGEDKMNTSMPTLITSPLLGLALATCPANAAEAISDAAQADAEQVAAQANAEASDSGGVADIIVTARRRAESAQTAPVSVTALGTEALEAKNIVNVANLATTVPGLSIRRASNTPDSATITIRGQVQSDPNITSDPSVGVYIGGMYVARAYGVLADLLDIDRVEVLRGPQGSVFGRNTIGGAIQIIPVKPDVSSGFTGFVKAGLGNYDTWSVSGAVTVPVIEDHLALRHVPLRRADRSPC